MTLKFKDYVLLYLSVGNKGEDVNTLNKLDKIAFWALTMLILKSGVKIQMDNKHFLTPEDCFAEMEDAYLNVPERPRLYWYIYQRKKYFGEFKSANIDINEYKNF